MSDKEDAPEDPMDKLDTNKKTMIEALEKSLGIVKTASSISGIARSTHYFWMKNDEQYAAVVESVTELAIDFAETKLHKLIEAETPSAIIFFLKTKGKKRGYIERTEHVLDKTSIPLINIDPLAEPENGE